MIADPLTKDNRSSASLVKKVQSDGVYIIPPENDSLDLLYLSTRQSKPSSEFKIPTSSSQIFNSSETNLNPSTALNATDLLQYDAQATSTHNIDFLILK